MLTTEVGPSDDELRRALDSAQLATLEQDLADAAEALEEVEVRRGSDASPSQRADAIRRLTTDGRFALAVESDLVRDGDLGTVEQVEARPESDHVALDGEPQPAQVRDPLEG